MNPNKKILENLFRIVSKLCHGTEFPIPRSHQGIILGLSTCSSHVHTTQVVGKILSIRSDEDRYPYLLEIGRTNFKRITQQNFRSLRHSRFDPLEWGPKSGVGTGIRIGRRFFSRKFPFPSIIVTCTNFAEDYYNTVFSLVLTKIYYQETFKMVTFLNRCVRERSLDQDEARKILYLVKIATKQFYEQKRKETPQLH